MPWWIVAAWSREPETRAESTQDRWASMKDLTVQTSLVRALEAPMDLAQGPERLHLEGGWLVPVFSGHLAGEWEREAERWFGGEDRTTVPRLPEASERGDQVLVGFVWTGGTGTATIPLADRADGLVLANRMVQELGVDRATAAPIASGAAPLVTGVTDAIVLAVDPALAAIFAGPEDRDPYEIVVYGASGEAERAARRARELLARRSEVWETLALDPNERIAWDRIAVERGVADASSTMHQWELATTTRYGLVAPQDAGEVDRWLSVIGDPTGQVDPRREIRVASLGIAPSGAVVNGLVGGVPHPPIEPSDPASAPTARNRVEPVFAESTVAVNPTANGLSLDVRVDSTLTFRAVGAPAAWIEVALPKMEQISGSFEIVLAELADGTSLVGAGAESRGAGPPKPEPKPKPGPGPDPDPEPPPEPPPELPVPPPEPGQALLRLQLPTPLPAGAEVVVHLVHVDTWPYAVFADGPQGTLSLGRSSGMQYFLPTVSPAIVGSPWKYVARVAVPAGGRLVGAMSGRTLREFEQGGWRVVEVDSEDHVAWFPAVAAGRFTAVDDPAQLGFPSIRVRMMGSHFGTLDQFGPEVRRVVQFYEGWLPAYPVREVEIFEAPQGMGGGAWIAPHGMVNVQTMLALGSMQVDGWVNPRDARPHLENAILAHELAHQYWGHLAPPASVEDFWIAESLSELYSCMYVAAAFDAQDCRVRLEDKRRTWEAAGAPAPSASLSGAYFGGHRAPVVYDYGAYLMGEVIERRIGREAFFGALDLMLRDHPYEPLTSERLQQYLEAASGRSFDDGFAYWIHGGFIPSLRLDWTAKGRRVTGTVTSDVPFGTFDVPVRIRTKEGALDVRVTCKDGAGALDAEAPAGKIVGVDLDPEGWVIAKKRESRQEKKKKR